MLCRLAVGVLRKWCKYN